MRYQESVFPLSDTVEIVLAVSAGRGNGVCSRLEWQSHKNGLSLDPWVAQFARVFPSTVVTSQEYIHQLSLCLGWTRNSVYTIKNSKVSPKLSPCLSLEIGKRHALIFSERTLPFWTLSRYGDVCVCVQPLFCPFISDSCCCLWFIYKHYIFEVVVTDVC